MICINCSNDNLNKNDFYIKDKKHNGMIQRVKSVGRLKQKNGIKIIERKVY